MPRVFDRNMFIMLFSIMIGVVIITFFAADIMARTSTEEELTTRYTAEKKELEEKNTNFTTRLLSSLSYLDKARELRSQGNYNFDLAYIWYTTTLNEDEEEKFTAYKNDTITHCMHAIENYSLGYDNFGVAKSMFTNTMNYSGKFSNLVNLYVNLTQSAAKLCMLRETASNYLIDLAENLTYVDGAASFKQNMSNITELLNNTLAEYMQELGNYNELEDGIEREYNIVGFSEIREEL